MKETETKATSAKSHITKLITGGMCKKCVAGLFASASHKTA